MVYVGGGYVGVEGVGMSLNKIELLFLFRREVISVVDINRSPKLQN